MFNMVKPLDNCGTFWEHRPGSHVRHTPDRGEIGGRSLRTEPQTGGSKRETRSDHALGSGLVRAVAGGRTRGPTRPDDGIDAIPNPESEAYQEVG